MKAYIRFCPHLERSALIVEEKMFRIKVAEKNEAHALYKKYFLLSLAGFEIFELK
jgi:hypothetical protein